MLRANEPRTLFELVRKSTAQVLEQDVVSYACCWSIKQNGSRRCSIVIAAMFGGLNHWLNGALKS